MTLQTLIKEKIVDKGSVKVAKKLGYSNTKKFEERVQSVIESSYLALDKSGYDFHYSTAQFIRKLSDVLEIPELFYNKVIGEINAQLLLDSQKKPYFFLETNFKRDSQPTFMLSVMQSTRYLQIDEKILKLSLNEQLNKLTEYIKVHNLRQPRLELWGKIESYAYFYDDETIFIFSTSGELLGAQSKYSYSRAYVFLK